MSDPLRPTLTIIPEPARTTQSRRTSTELTVAFGPTRSGLIDRALAHARAGALTEILPGRFESTFTLQRDPGAFAHAASLCRLARPWQGTTVEADGRPVAPLRVQEMGFCAAHQLVRQGSCRIPLEGLVPAKCELCPLFDPDRLIPETSRSGDRWRRWSSTGARGRRLRLVREDECRAPPTRFVVVFGPSRSFDCRRALARARAGATRFTERPDGSWEAEFVLGDDPQASLALRTTLRLLLMVRGTEVTRDGLPVSPGQALGWVIRMRPTYVVPPPRDLVSLLVDDLAANEGDSASPPGGGWSED